MAPNSIEVAQNDRGANAHPHKHISMHFESSSPVYGRFSFKNGRFGAVFRTIVLKTQDDRACVK